MDKLRVMHIMTVKNSLKLFVCKVSIMKSVSETVECKHRPTGQNISEGFVPRLVFSLNKIHAWSRLLVESIHWNGFMGMFLHFIIVMSLVKRIH
jgi:hypothetical protein